MTESTTLLKNGIDVAVHFPGKHFPGRIARVLKNGQQVDGVEWVGSSGEGYELELTDGSIVPTGVVTPGDHTCWHCDQRLRQSPVGVFTCNCENWKSGL